MALKVVYMDSVGTGVQAELTGIGDKLFVQEGVMVARTDGVASEDAAIRSTAFSNTLDVRGTVVASRAAIQLGDNAVSDFWQELTLSSTAFVKSFSDAAIRVNAYASEITNAGRVEGYRGMEFNGQGSNFVSKLVNSGTITGEGVAIYRIASATDGLTIENTGTITGGAYSFYSESASSVDYITNKGFMSGDIELGGGADRYNGELGAIDGYVSGSDGSDTLYGGAGADTFYGGNDADYLDGGAGNDWLDGGDGSDVIFGRAGNDTLVGGSLADTMNGGTGNDLYFVDDAGDQVIELAGEGTDTVQAGINYTLTDNVEKLVLVGSTDINGTGNALSNAISGNSGKNILKGMAGNDKLDGGFNADRMEGGTGNDTYVVDDAGDVVVELSGQGTDTVLAAISHKLSANIERLGLTGSDNINGTGNTLANILTGNIGNNILKGGAGNDTLIGGKGADQLYGGSGKDMFVFKAAGDSTAASAGRDKIFDFTSGSDRFDLRGVDANAAAAGDQAFKFIGSAGFHKVAGELRFKVSSGDTFVQGDTNGDGVADFSFVLDTAVNLKSGDFLL